MYNPENIFAKIINDKLPANKVFEDESIIAFYDLYPKAPVHILIIPKGQYIDYEDFINKALREEVYHFFKTIPLIARQAGLDEDYKLLTNKGAGAGQEIFHFHFHLLGNKK